MALETKLSELEAAIAAKPDVVEEATQIETAAVKQAYSEEVTLRAAAIGKQRADQQARLEARLAKKKMG